MSIIHSLSDDALIKALQRDNAEAFRALYDRYVKELHSFVLRTSKSPALAEDLVHDVYIKIWESRSQINPDKAFKPYLFAIAKNHLINLIRRAKNESYILCEITKHSSTFDNDTELRVNYRESNSIIIEAISRLPEQSRRVFNLCKIEGKSYRQVAHELGISEGTVNTQMVRALKSIKKYVILKGAMSLVLMYILK